MPKLASIIFVLLFSLYAHPSEEAHDIYFVSTKSDKVNLRKGPDYKYPVKWIIVRKNEPLMVTRVFDQWRRVKDVDEDEGWVHVSMISKKRFLVVKNKHNIPIFQENNESSQVIGYLEPEVRAELISYKDEWCKIMVSNIKAWAKVDNFWGFSDEEID